MVQGTGSAADAGAGVAGFPGDDEESGDEISRWTPSQCAALALEAITGVTLDANVLDGPWVGRPVLWPAEIGKGQVRDRAASVMLAARSPCLRIGQWRRRPAGTVVKLPSERGCRKRIAAM
jgi:hypothetical protein